MRRPRHAADDGSFGRSTGMAAGRGAVLLAVAVVLGIVLLNAADDTPTGVSAGGSATTSTTGRTSTTAAPTTIATLPQKTPAEVKLIAGNGTDVKGVARKATDELKAAGYNVLSPVDAPKVPVSAVYYVGEYSREAAAVAAQLGLPATTVAPVPTPPPLADSRGANVVLIVGPELAQRYASTTTTTKAAASTTTTRAASSSSTTRASSSSSTSTTKP